MLEVFDAKVKSLIQQILNRGGLDRAVFCNLQGRDLYYGV